MNPTLVFYHFIVKAFKRLDQARVGHLLSSDLAEFMQDNSIVLSEAELRYLMSRFDCNKDGLITYPEYKILYY